MGTRISPVSSYRNSQYDIAFFCGSLQWLCIGLLAIFLILLLSRQCFHDRCGGEVINSQLDRQSTLTQMGSGRLLEEGFGKSGYFKNIQVVDSSKNLEEKNHTLNNPIAMICKHVVMEIGAITFIMEAMVHIGHGTFGGAILVNNNLEGEKYILKNISLARQLNVAGDRLIKSSG